MASATEQGDKAGAASAEGGVEALPGKARRGREWEPAHPDPAAAPALPELREPRPYVTRYPIPDEEFRELKGAAPNTDLREATAQPVRDSRAKKLELGSLAMAPAATPPGLPPLPALTGANNFAGIPSTGWIPPDCTMAVGPDHVLASVNSSVAIFSKAGGGALLQRTLTQWFANVAQDMTIFDPKALFDQHNGRWVLLAVAVKNSPMKSFHLLSVSATADPLGTWRNYALDAKRDGSTTTGNWADYPALGVDAGALYITSNMFQFNGGFQYAKIRVVPKAGPYSGGTAPFTDFVRMRNADGTMAFTIQPCHTFGAPQVEYLVNSAFPQGDYLTIWSIAGPPGAPALNRKQVGVSPYSLPPNADQNGGAPPLNTGDVRALHAVFRGDSLWTALNTAHNWGGATNRSSILWCQIRAASPTVVQQGLFGTNTHHYFYPACCPDNNGNMIAVFSRSSASGFGSVLFTGRRATDPLGTLQPSILLKAGTAAYFNQDGSGRNRWGDYCGVSADPSNPRSIWFYSEYASALNTWGTWIGSAFF